jgi:hypothetical protein
MPKIFQIDGYIFFFFSNEGIPREKCHVHVRKGASLAKFWVDPKIYCASSYEFSSNELAVIERIIIENVTEIRRFWNEFFL